VTNLGFTFSKATAFNGGTSIFLGCFDIIHKQAQLIYFFSFSIITKDISKWDVSKVTSLFATFKGASLFNSDVSNWATSQVTSLDQTFTRAAAFNSGK
jgi:surface protein